MSWFSSFMHPERGYQEGQNQLDKYYNDAQGTLQPYNTQGQDQYQNLNEIIEQLKNPQALVDKWSEGYETSGAAKDAQGRATEHGLDAASSMGLMGSNTALNAVQAGTSEIGNIDKQNYLKDLMEKYMGAAGLSQGVYSTGANTAGQMSNNATTQGQNSAQMKFGEKNAPGSLFGKILGTAAGVAGSYLGGPSWNTTGGA